MHETGFKAILVRTKLGSRLSWYARNWVQGYLGTHETGFKATLVRTKLGSRLSWYARNWVQGYRGTH